MADNPNRRSLGVFNVDEGTLEDFEFSFSQTLTSNEQAESISDTVSLTDSVFTYREENGRTYHTYRDATYFMPSDQEEIERQHIHYAILRKAMGDVSQLAPWTQTHFPRRVLDVATGTGEWCFDFAEQFPQTALVIGTELSDMQPRETPPNVAFVIDDSTQPWLDEDLDYVHTRCTNGCWDDMYAQVVRQAFDRLNPGGWLECQEPDLVLCCDDGTMPPGHGLRQWTDELMRVSILAGRPATVAQELKGWLERAGFVDVQERVFKVPTCAWPEDRDQREVGWWMENMLSEHVSAISRAYQSRVNGISVEEHELSLIPVRRDIKNRDAHTYMRLFVVLGRKPGTNLDRFNLDMSKTAEIRQQQQQRRRQDEDLMED